MIKIVIKDLSNRSCFSFHRILSSKIHSSSDISHHRYRSILSVSFSSFICHILILFRYVAAFSFALAFFNAVPCYALDGQYILSALIEYCLPNLARYQRLILLFGTSLLIGNISLAFTRYFLFLT